MNHEHGHCGLLPRDTVKRSSIPVVRFARPSAPSSRRRFVASSLSHASPAVSEAPMVRRRVTPGQRAILGLVAVVVCGGGAFGQPRVREPHIGYACPAGGQQGTVVRVTVGGQFLGGVADVHVSGEGVRASLVRYVRPVRNLSKEQRQLLRQRLREAWDRRMAETGGAGAGARPKSAQRAGAESRADDRGEKDLEGVKLPDHPLLHELEDKSLRELAHIRHMLQFPRWKRQPNRQLAEVALIEVAIDAGAAPGDRELRLRTPRGLTNPVRFEVGLLPEAREFEPNDPGAPSARPGPQRGMVPPPGEVLELPVLLNGQIMPGDVDRFRFRARKGQPLVVATHARRLIPYLADAVPGWFQATVALYDAAGDELAFADDYRFHPDPVLHVAIPEDGVYELQIRDALYRGREDFVYRVAVGELPFITSMFPLGGRAGVETTASIDGWNLPAGRLPLDTGPGGSTIRRAAWRQGPRLSNHVPYAVDVLPECNEVEPNDTAAADRPIEVPCIVNGRIAPAGDRDVFAFTAQAGDAVVAEVVARRLHSPLDALIRLTDASGGVLAWNDDCMDKDGHLHRGPGLLTHHADPYLTARVPKDGTYLLHLSDAAGHGGDACGYRLRIGPPRPDFALRVTPSTINVPAGRTTAIGVHALRRDGFVGPIDMVLKDAPAGFTLGGARIPPHCNRIRMTLSAPRQPSADPIVLQVEGRALVGGQTVARPAVPCDDVMQAFLWRHLVPSRELLVAVTGKRRAGPPARLASRDAVRIPMGGTAAVRVSFPRPPLLPHIRLALSEPPDGLRLGDVSATSDGLVFEVAADPDKAKVGLVDNLIVAAHVVRAGQKAEPGTARSARDRKPRRSDLGLLPAVPFEIVPP